MESDNAIVGSRTEWLKRFNVRIAIRKINHKPEFRLLREERSLETSYKVMMGVVIRRYDVERK